MTPRLPPPRLPPLRLDEAFERERNGLCVGLSLVAAWRNSGVDKPGDPIAFVVWLRKELSGCAHAEMLRREAAVHAVLPLCFAEGPRLDAAMSALSPSSEAPLDCVGERAGSVLV